MEFLDSLDLDTSHKKSHRVRSWYLYEQFKSLERNQLDAAQKLKDKSYQERILRQELSERRARRKLYDQFGISPSESRVESITSEDATTTFSGSNYDFFDKFSEFPDDERLTPDVIQVPDTQSEYNCSQDGSSTCKGSVTEFQSVEETEVPIENKISLKESIASVIENINLIPVSDTQNVEDTNMSYIGEDINAQLETLRDEFKCLENIAIEEPDRSYENNSEVISSEELEHVHINNENTKKECGNVVAVWSRLVSFAYQIMNLNHGNCYCDYSSQFLTAVLACDVLRRGVNRMCDLLQPYVSPIKFATDESDVSSYCYKKEKRKKSAQYTKCRKRCVKKQRSNTKLKENARTLKENARTHDSDPKRMARCWQPFSTQSSSCKNKSKKKNRASEPLNNMAKCLAIKELSQDSSQSSLWPNFSTDSFKTKESCECSCHRKPNPMLKIARYIDNILMDIDDSKYT